MQSNQAMDLLCGVGCRHVELLRAGTETELWLLFKLGFVNEEVEDENDNGMDISHERNCNDKSQNLLRN